MRHLYLLLFSLFLCNILNAQLIPIDSLYLGQTLPGNKPVIFKLAVSPGFFAGERIAISNDGKSIYYNELNGYESYSISRIKKYHYDGTKWSDSEVIFEGFGGVALSVTGDTIFTEKNFEPYYSVKEGIGWSTPVKFMPNLNAAHYLHVTQNGIYYADTRPTSLTGKGSWSQLSINGDTVEVVSLGIPTNSHKNQVWDFYDFCVSDDDKFMIGSSGRLWVSFHKDDGTWTNPKYFDASINFGPAMWGNYISPDNKFLFYTTASSSNYSDGHVYWVKIDGLIDSLKQTNFAPYAINKITNQIDTVGSEIAIAIPDSIFIDDDGRHTLSYSALLSNNKPLPSWLIFDEATKRFSGISVEPSSFSVKVIATDTAGASAFAIFSLKVVADLSPTALHFDKSVQVYPNPTSDKITVSFGPATYAKAFIEIVDVYGQVVQSATCQNSSDVTFCFTNSPKGIYIVKMNIDGVRLNKKISLK
jgi:hypothetical protein